MSSFPQVGIDAVPVCHDMSGVNVTQTQSNILMPYLTNTDRNNNSDEVLTHNVCTIYNVMSYHRGHGTSNHVTQNDQWQYYKGATSHIIATAIKNENDQPIKHERTNGEDSKEKVLQSLNKFVCPHCGNGFSYVCILRRHLRSLCSASHPAIRVKHELVDQSAVSGAVIERVVPFEEDCSVVSGIICDKSFKLKMVWR